MDISFEIDPKRTVNLLKTIVNKYCEDEFTWFDDIGESPNLYEVLEAIRILEKHGEVKRLNILDDREETGDGS